MRDDPRLAGHIDDIDHKTMSYLVSVPHAWMPDGPRFYNVTVSSHYAAAPMALLKVLDLLEGNVKPMCVFHYDFAQHSTRKSMREVIKQYVSKSRRECGTDHRYLLLEHFLHIPQWRNELRELFIDGVFADCTTVTFCILDNVDHEMAESRPWLP